MASLEERLDAAERMIKMPGFRENKGLGNEVGYYVFDLNYLNKYLKLARGGISAYQRALLEIKHDYVAIIPDPAF